MGIMKKRDVYFVEYYGKKYEVSEEIYRVWAYHTNKEQHASKHYSPRLVHGKHGDYVAPSRLISFEEYISSRGDQAKLNPAVVSEKLALQEILTRCINALPEKQAVIIRMLYFEDYSEQQVASVINMCQSSISNYKANALQALRKLLSAEGYSDTDLFSMLHN